MAKNSSKAVYFDGIAKMEKNLEKLNSQIESLNQKRDLLTQEIEQHEKLLEEQKALLGKLLSGGGHLDEKIVADLIIKQNSQAEVNQEAV